MPTHILTEEPQEMDDLPGNTAEELGSGSSFEKHRTDHLHSKTWTEEEWTKEILEQGALSTPTSKLQHRVDGFLAYANDDERNVIEVSRTEMRQMMDLARTEHDKRQRYQPGKRAAMRAKIKTYWNDASQVAFSYIQMLDVMVSQAPEYVALAYGAVKIILVVQVNYEEVKQKVPAFMKKASAKFKILDHLTAYRPSRNLLSTVSQAYHLYIKFLAKAVKLYTRCRLKTYIKAFSNPWKNRFQGLVDSIEATFQEIKDIAQYHGLYETHMSLAMNRESLGLLRNQQANYDRVLSMLEELSQMVAVRFSKSDDIRETAANVRQHVEEGLDQPVVAALTTEPTQRTPRNSNPDSASSQEPSPPSMDQVLDDIFPELRAQHDESERRARAIEELPSMHSHRSKQKSLLKSERLIAWLQSNVSELLWIDGSNLLTVVDCNALFTNPLLLAGEDEFESTVVLWYNCQGTSSEESKRYAALVQTLISQILKQNPDVFEQLRHRLTRERTTDAQSLWDTFVECIYAVDATCIFIIINCADELGNGEQSTVEEIETVLKQLNQLLHDQAKLVKVLLTAGLRKETSSNAVISSVTLHSQLMRRQPTRTLSIDGLQADAPLLSHDIIRIQEKRCEALRFTQLPFLYTRGTTIFNYEQGQLLAFVITEASGIEPTATGDLRPLVLQAWSVDHNGQYFTKRYREIRISQFKGQRRIRDLRYIPTGFLPNEAMHRKELVRRGKRYWTLGHGVHHKQTRTGEGYHRVMVDQSSRPLDAPSAQEIADQFQEIDVANLKPGILILCPPCVEVYILSDLHWVTVNLNDIEDLAQTAEQTHIFEDKLQLDQEYKDLIEKSVKFYEVGKARNGKGGKDIDDFAVGKGKGLVIMLYGHPGVGKTLTAESVALSLCKPLFSVSASHISLEGQSIEENLQRIFHLARRWEAVLLL